MKLQNQKDLQELMTSVKVASTLRTFPNGRNLTLFESVSLNQIGKLISHIGHILGKIRDGKRPRKALGIIGNASSKLEELLNKEGDSKNE